MGFEPTDAFTSPVFKTGSFDRSDSSPNFCYNIFTVPTTNLIITKKSHFVNSFMKKYFTFLKNIYIPLQNHKTSAYYDIYFPLLSSQTISTDTSLGDTPEILEACPRDFGLILLSFCLASNRNP